MDMRQKRQADSISPAISGPLQKKPNLPGKHNTQPSGSRQQEAKSLLQPYPPPAAPVNQLTSSLVNNKVVSIPSAHNASNSPQKPNYAPIPMKSNAPDTLVPKPPQQTQPPPQPYQMQQQQQQQHQQQYQPPRPAPQAQQYQPPGSGMPKNPSAPPAMQVPHNHPVQARKDLPDIPEDAYVFNEMVPFNQLPFNYSLVAKQSVENDGWKKYDWRVPASEPRVYYHLRKSEDYCEIVRALRRSPYSRIWTNTPVCEVVKSFLGRDGDYKKDGGSDTLEDSKFSLVTEMKDVSAELRKLHHGLDRELEAFVRSVHRDQEEGLKYMYKHVLSSSGFMEDVKSMLKAEAEKKVMAEEERDNPGINPDMRSLVVSKRVEEEMEKLFHHKAHKALVGFGGDSVTMKYSRRVYTAASNAADRKISAPKQQVYMTEPLRAYYDGLDYKPIGIVGNLNQFYTDSRSEECGIVRRGSVVQVFFSMRFWASSESWGCQAILSRERDTIQLVHPPLCDNFSSRFLCFTYGREMVADNSEYYVDGGSKMATMYSGNGRVSPTERTNGSHADAQFVPVENGQVGDNHVAHATELQPSTPPASQEIPLLSARDMEEFADAFAEDFNPA